ncbi:hypothetical protein JHK82_024735 [Glycine max]|nr:hypothetical protein JHK82_024735 [Glycine max]
MKLPLLELSMEGWCELEADLSTKKRAKLSIGEHETDPNLRNIELEGTFEQIKEASNMVKDLLLTVSMSAPPKSTPGVPGALAPCPLEATSRPSCVRILQKDLAPLEKDVTLHIELLNCANRHLK